VIITKLQVAPVELVVSSESSCAVRLARHSQNAWARHVECVVSSRVESSQVEFELIAVRARKQFAFYQFASSRITHPRAMVKSPKCLV